MNKQCTRIIEHFDRKNSITSDEAAEIYGIKRLASRISELRSMGFPIGDVWEEGSNRYGERVRWKRYFLVKEAPDAISNNDPRISA